MHRFFNPIENINTEIIRISKKDEIHHLRSVLRLKKGDTISIFNGQGLEASGEIADSKPNEVSIKVIKITEIKQTLPQLILACAIPKKSKFEIIIEKCTELGVDTIIPLKTQRTEIKLNDDRGKKKQLRYQTIAINAAKQSQRNTIPTIYPVTKFKDAIAEFKDTSHMIIPSLIGKRKKLTDTLLKIKSPQSIIFFIGPEGDFTENEYHYAQQEGCLPVSLGPLILRVETAAISSMACANLIYNS